MQHLNVDIAVFKCLYSRVKNGYIVYNFEHAA